MIRLRGGVLESHFGPIFPASIDQTFTIGRCTVTIAIKRAFQHRASSDASSFRNDINPMAPIRSSYRQEWLLSWLWENAHVIVTIATSRAHDTESHMRKRKVYR